MLKVIRMIYKVLKYDQTRYDVCARLITPSEKVFGVKIRGAFKKVGSPIPNMMIIPPPPQWQILQTLYEREDAAVV